MQKRWSSRELERQFKTALFKRLVLTPAKVSGAVRQGQLPALSVIQEGRRSMTMPNERMRALRWGHELLAEMPLDPSLPQACRAQAQRLSRKHPSPQELVQWVQAGQQGLPLHWAVAIAQTYDLFTSTQGRAEGSAQTQSALLYTLRHYPDVFTARLMTSDRGFAVWLELER